MHPNETLIHQFYEAFQARDSQRMAACYADDVVFTDEVFIDLVGPRAGAMWQMLCERGRDLELSFTDVQADDTRGQARWTARYTFSATGRPVVNVIDAAFEFRDGRIVRHRDRFDFWRWSRQALGVPGWLLGWSSMLRRKVQAQAMRNLEDWIARRAA